MNARDDAVRRYHEAWRAVSSIEALAKAGEFDVQRLDAHRGYWEGRLATARADYSATVPQVTVSRCPLTKELLAFTVDVDGLDGPWWNYDEPARPLPGAGPATLLGFDGAVRVTTVPMTPFAVCPGPEVPTVIRRLLVSDRVHAVLSSITVGGDTAYVTTYFADPAHPPLPVPPNDWGTDHYLAADDDGLPLRIGSGDEAREGDLGGWLDTGRCWWIAPGDDSMTLHQGRDGCPYLGLTGRTEPQWLLEGRSSYAPDGG